MSHPYAVFNVTPVLSVANGYTTGQVLGQLQKISGAALRSGGAAELISAVLLDNTNSGVAIDVLFFDAVVSPGADKAALGLSKADCAHWLGTISIATGDYVANGTTSKQATHLVNCGLMLKAADGVNNQKQSDAIWVLLVARGSLTTVAANDLQLKLGLRQG